VRLCLAEQDVPPLSHARSSCGRSVAPPAARPGEWYTTVFFDQDHPPTFAAGQAKPGLRRKAVVSMTHAWCYGSDTEMRKRKGAL